jgi:hypothetical protein
MSSKANTYSSHRAENVATHSTQETICLSPDPVLMKSAEMTQQQKIVAALARAGASHSTARVYESTGVAVDATDPDPLEQQTTTIPEPHRAPWMPTPKFPDVSHLLICCGLALAVLSCYLLVTFQ